MPMVEERAALPLRRPRLRPVGPGGAVRRMKQDVRARLRNWVGEFVEHRHLIALSLALTAVALAADYCCGVYVNSTKGVKVPDLILDRFDAIDLSFLFVYGYMVLLVIMFSYPLFFRVRTLHVVACQFSLLLIVRSLFMVFTHLETPAGSVPVSFPGFFRNFYFENDMFFSGHTAMPFLGFYLFRGSPLRYVFLVGSVVMGVAALAMHLHYSIDVFAAFFMTYCSYRMGNVLLSKLDRNHQG